MEAGKMINERVIEELLNHGKRSSMKERKEVLEKAEDARGLSLEEAAMLLEIEGEEEIRRLFEAAKKVKEKIYGRRIVIFTPLYTSNECQNNCLYCGFRVANRDLHRKTLSSAEIAREARIIEKQGHKRILLVCGEDGKKTTVDHITEALEKIYQQTDIRRINVNAAPMSVEDFKKLKAVGIGTYQIFQETYHRETYQLMHPGGPKSDYDHRLRALDRAFEAGIDDFGIGVLFGLYDYRFEVLASLMHAQYMEGNYRVGPHTLSIPRLRPAMDSGLKETPYPIGDMEFKKIVAVYRLALPYTGIILSTREDKGLRDQLLQLGVSQVSTGSKTSPGGNEKADKEARQFEISDERPLDEMLQVICRQGHLPSFCTACYRKKRTGSAFMELVKEEQIHEFCEQNAILTLKENLLDYASEETITIGEALIEKSLKAIKNPRIRKVTEEGLKEIEKGKRDIYF